MSRDVAGIVYWIGGLLAEARIAEAVPVFAALLHDRDDSVQQSAASYLIAMGRVDAELRKQIAGIHFPESAVHGWRQKLPDWVQVGR